MSDTSRQRREKKTGAATHRTGTLRAAVKPGVLNGSNESAQASQSATNIAAFINEFMSALPAGSTTQTAWGDKLALVADTLRKNYQLSANEDIYLLLDLNRTGAGETGMLLSQSGLRLNGGTAGRVVLSWKEFLKTTVGISDGLLVIGTSGISTPDAKVIASLLQQLQSKLA